VLIFSSSRFISSQLLVVSSHRRPLIYYCSVLTVVLLRRRPIAPSIYYLLVIIAQFPHSPPHLVAFSPFRFLVYSVLSAQFSPSPCRLVDLFLIFSFSQFSSSQRSVLPVYFTGNSFFSLRKLMTLSGEMASSAVLKTISG
jgi:hypothetical protein